MVSRSHVKAVNVSASPPSVQTDPRLNGCCLSFRPVNKDVALATTGGAWAKKQQHYIQRNMHQIDLEIDGNGIPIFGMNDEQQY